MLPLLPPPPPPPPADAFLNRGPTAGARVGGGGTAAACFR